MKFDPKWGGPESVVFDKLDDWSQRPEEGIKHYSGMAVYRKTFDLPLTPHNSVKGLPESASGKSLYLDLGVVKNMARVRLNGKDLGLIWTAPWRVEITDAARPKGNELEIEVINTWANRIIGDSRLPQEKRLTWMVHPHLGPNSPLLPAGLIGPVTIMGAGD